MKFEVTSAIKFNGKRFAEGDTVEMTTEEAAALPAHCLKAIEKAKPGPKPKDQPEAGKEAA